MAWVFDITREGVKLDSQASGSKGLFAAAALLIVLALGWYFYGQPSFRKGDVATPIVADRNSIAVLPFANISGKADQDYFSDGMTEELLNVLAKDEIARRVGAALKLSLGVSPPVATRV